MCPIIYGGLTSGGASAPLAATVTLTANRASGFVANHVFDLGYNGPHATQATFTVTAITPDGETFGVGPGNLQITTGVDSSLDNVVFVGGGPYTFTATLIAVTNTETTVYVAPRYVRAKIELDDDTFSIYSGPNNPVISVRVDLIYN